MRCTNLTSRVLFVSAALMLAIGVTDAQAASARNGAGFGRPDRSQTGSGVVDSIVGATIDAITAQTIRGYFQSNPTQVQGLPPGIAKNLARGKPLPPGIAKRYMPSNLQTRLPAYPGYELLIADRNVLLVSVATGIIADILLDAL